MSTSITATCRSSAYLTPHSRALGGVVLGVFPATYALFRLCRDDLSTVSRGPLLPTYWRAFREQFWRANALGYIVVVVVGAGMIDHRILLEWESSLAPVLRALLLACTMFLLVALPTVWVVCAALGRIDVAAVRSALVELIAGPHWTLLRVLALAAVVAVGVLAPALAVLFGASGGAMAVLLAGGRPAAGPGSRRWAQ